MTEEIQTLTEFLKMNIAAHLMLNKIHLQHLHSKLQTMKHYQHRSEIVHYWSYIDGYFFFLTAKSSAPMIDNQQLLASYFSNVTQDDP